MSLFITIFIVLAILLLNELWWRSSKAHGEVGRKVVHITVGSYVAFWPFYLSWSDIELISIAFFIVVFISKNLNVFQAIHSVQRPTWGELCFALAVGGVALVTHNKWIYMTALLQMSLADGLAAILGARYGNRVKYSIFGHTKSLVGSLTFLIVSVVLLSIYWLFAPNIEFSYSFIFIALAATFMENFSVYGLDNLFVPLLTAIGLKYF